MKTAPTDKKQPSQKKAIEAIELCLGEIADAADSLTWIGDELSKRGEAMSQGTLIRHAAIAIAKQADEALASLNAIGGAA